MLATFFLLFFFAQLCWVKLNLSQDKKIRLNKLTLPPPRRLHKSHNKVHPPRTLHNTTIHFLFSHPLRQADGPRPYHAKGRLWIVSGVFDDSGQAEEHALPGPHLLIRLQDSGGGGGGRKYKQMSKNYCTVVKYDNKRRTKWRNAQDSQAARILSHDPQTETAFMWTNSRSTVPPSFSPTTHQDSYSPINPLATVGSTITLLLQV